MRCNFEQYFFKGAMKSCLSRHAEMLKAASVPLSVMIALMSGFFLLAGCGNQQDSPAKVVDGTAQMAAELANIYEQATAAPMPYFHLNSRRVEQMRISRRTWCMRCVLRRSGRYARAGGCTTDAPIP